MNSAERGFHQRRQRRDEDNEKQTEAIGTPLRDDQARIAFGGLLRRELRGLLGEDNATAAKLAEVAADQARRGADEATRRLTERRQLAAEIVKTAAYHGLVPWLRLSELPTEDRRALQI